MNTQYYLNNGDSSTICEIPEPNNDYFQIQNNLSELETSIQKKTARANLGIDSIVDSLNRKDKELERSLQNKADVVDISNYMTTGDILPAVSSYMYQGDPISGIRIIQSTETTVVFNVGYSDTNEAFYVVFEGNNIDGYTYQETYDEFEGDEIPEYIKEIFGKYSIATTQNAGLMSAQNVKDLNKLNNHAVLDNKDNRFTGNNIFRGTSRFTDDVEFENISADDISVGNDRSNVRIQEGRIQVSDGVSIIPTVLTPDGVSSQQYHKWKDGIRYELATTEKVTQSKDGLMSKEDKTLLDNLTINVQSVEITPYLESEDPMPLANFYLYNGIPISNWRIIDVGEGAYTILFCIDNDETVRHYIQFEGENIEEYGFNYVDEYDEESVQSWIKEAFGIYNKEASTTSAGLMSASDKTKLSLLDPYEDYNFEILAGNSYIIEPINRLLFDNQKLYIIIEEISGQKTVGTMTGLIKVNIIDNNIVIGSTELFTSSYDVHSTDGVALSTLLNGNAMTYNTSIELSADGHYVNGMCFIR